MEENKKVDLKKLKAKRLIIQYIWISFGVLLVDLSFYFFLDPTNLVMGGMLGITVIVEPYISHLGWLTPSIFLYFVNGACLLLGLIFLGKDFFLKTIYASVLSPSILFIFENTLDPNFFVREIGDNQVLISLVCAAVLQGFGVGLAVKYNGSTGGMDVVQKIISKKFKVPMSATMYVTDAIVVLFSGFVFGEHFAYKIDYAVYGILGVVVIAYIVDFVALSLKPRRTLYVITKNPDLVKDVIYKELDRGVTFSRVIGGYTGDELVMVICTMDKNESYRMTAKITSIDPKAFTFVTSCKEVKGEYTHRGII